MTFLSKIYTSNDYYFRGIHKKTLKLILIYLLGFAHATFLIIHSSQFNNLSIWFIKICWSVVFVPFTAMSSCLVHQSSIFQPILILSLNLVPASLDLLCLYAGLPLWCSSVPSDITQMDSNGFLSIKLSPDQSNSSSYWTSWKYMTIFISSTAFFCTLVDNKAVQIYGTINYVQMVTKI